MNMKIINITDSKKSWDNVYNINKTECDNLLILFDIYSIETAQTVYLMFYLSHFVDLF